MTTAQQFNEAFCETPIEKEPVIFRGIGKDTLIMDESHILGVFRKAQINADEVERHYARYPYSLSVLKKAIKLIETLDSLAQDKEIAILIPKTKLLPLLIRIEQPYSDKVYGIAPRLQYLMNIKEE